jgi:tetratricopeptide (TPR) repeat protein
MAKPELTEWDEDLTASADEEYAALVRAIRWARGFGLLFVQCSPAEGERLMERVRDDIADKTVDVLRLEGEIDDLYATVAALPEIDKTNVLFITGLEKSLVPYIKPGYGSEGDYYAKDTVPKILGKLNLQREKFRETFGLCFVFLVPLYAMKYLIRRAADFYDWRSGVWEFVGSADEVQQTAQRILQEGDYTQYLSWTPKQRRERILEIDDLLADETHLPDDISHLRFEQGNICTADQQFEWAIACYDAVLAINPNFHQALYNKGNVLRNLGCHKEAIDSYDAALVIKPDAYESLNNKGVVLRSLGLHEEAVACYDAALAIRPYMQEALNNKGIALSKLGRYEEAFTSFDTALVIQPNDHDALYNKGHILDNLGRFKEAIACYDAALSINPNDYIALNNKGVALSNLNQFEEAITYFDFALLIKPDYQLAIDNKEEVLEKLANTPTKTKQ